MAISSRRVRGRWTLGALVAFVLLGLGAFTNDSSNIPAASAGAYNRSAAVQYADTWAKARNGNYVSYSTDCTNYASQVMEYGYLPMIHGDHNKDNVRLWYAYSDMLGPKNSKSWSAADWMNTHFYQYQGSRYQTQSGIGYLEGGDIIILQWPDSTIPSHVRVIVGVGYSQEYVPSSEGGTIGHSGVWGTLANQHTTDRKRVIWNDGFPPGTGVWYHKIIY
jgi:hypothetical protein